MNILFINILDYRFYLIQNLSQQSIYFCRHNMKSRIGFEPYFIFNWIQKIATRTIVAVIVFILIISSIKFIKQYSNPEKDSNPQNSKGEQINNPGKEFLRYIFRDVENVEHLVAIITVVVLSWDAPSQRKRTHYEAWQVVNSAQGQGGSGGRIKALEYLNKERESVAGLTAYRTDLTGIQLQKADLFRADFSDTCLNNSNFKGAILREAKLNGAKLRNANLQKADLSNASLENAKLENADLRNANLSAVNFRNADLIDAKLEDANLTNAILQNTDLRNANLCYVNLNRTQLINAKLCRTNLRESKLIDSIAVGANLWKSDLSHAHLNNANLKRANLSLANLQGADLKNANLNNADLYHTNLKSAKNLTVEQVQAANNWDRAYYDSEFRQKLGL